MMRMLMLRILLAIRGEGEQGPRMKRFGSWVLRHGPGMLTCAEFEAFVCDYYEGDLPEAQRGRFEMHMSLCPMCRVAFDTYVRAVELGQQVCERDDELPEDLPDELITAILAARAEP